MSKIFLTAESAEDTEGEKKEGEKKKV